MTTSVYPPNNSPFSYKIVEGTTSASQGGLVNVAHGIDAGDIVSLTCLVDFDGNGYGVPPAFNFTLTFAYDVTATAVNIVVANHSGNSASILSKPFRALITLQE